MQECYWQRTEIGRWKGIFKEINALFLFTEFTKSENNNGRQTCTFCEYLLLTFAYSINIDDTITNSEVINIKFYECVCDYEEEGLIIILKI